MFSFCLIPPFSSFFSLEFQPQSYYFSTFYKFISHTVSLLLSTFSFFIFFDWLILLFSQGVTSVVDEYLKNIGNNVADANESTLLTKLESEWNTHQTTMVMIRDILMYMDRTFVKQTKKTPIYMMGLNKFNLNVSRHKDVKERFLFTTCEKLGRYCILPSWKM